MKMKDFLLYLGKQPKLHLLLLAVIVFGPSGLYCYLYKEPPRPSWEGRSSLPAWVIKQYHLSCAVCARPATWSTTRIPEDMTGELKFSDHPFYCELYGPGLLTAGPFGPTLFWGTVIWMILVMAIYEKRRRKSGRRVSKADYW